MTRSVTKTRAAGSYLGDLIRAEFHRAYNYVEAPVKNPSSSTDLSGYNPLGQPLKIVSTVYNFVLTTDEANTTALMAYDKNIILAHGATSDDRYLILKRGPVVIDQDVLPVLDVDAATLVPATIATALAALDAPIIAVSEVTPTKTQTF